MGVMNGELCPTCGRIFRSAGRQSGLSPEQVTSITQHYEAPHPKPTQKEYCEQAGISLKTYWRITHPDRARIEAARAAQRGNKE